MHENTLLDCHAAYSKLADATFLDLSYSEPEELVSPSYAMMQRTGAHYLIVVLVGSSLLAVILIVIPSCLSEEKSAPVCHPITAMFHIIYWLICIHP